MDHENRMRGDAEFARWYTTHHDRIQSLCARILRDDAAGEDLAQETLLKAWTKRESIREEDVGAWLTVVARNLCISYMRRHGRVVPTDAMPEVPDASADPLTNVERLESRRAVRRALREISERQRRALYLHEVNEADYEEIGQEFGLSSEGVRSIAFRARRALRERLAAIGEGLGGWIFGTRVRLHRFSRGNPAVTDSTATALMQAAVSLVLAVVLASPPASAPSRAPIDVPGQALRSVAQRTAETGMGLDGGTSAADSWPSMNESTRRKSLREIRDDSVTIQRGSDWEIRIPGPNGEPLIVVGERTEPDDGTGPLPGEESKRQQVWDIAVEQACEEASELCDEVFSDPEGGKR